MLGGREWGFQFTGGVRSRPRSRCVPTVFGGARLGPGCRPGPRSSGWSLKDLALAVRSETLDEKLIDIFRAPGSPADSLSIAPDRNLPAGLPARRLGGSSLASRRNRIGRGSFSEHWLTAEMKLNVDERKARPARCQACRDRAAMKCTSRPAARPSRRYEWKRSGSQQVHASGSAPTASGASPAATSASRASAREIDRHVARTRGPHGARQRAGEALAQGIDDGPVDLVAAGTDVRPDRRHQRRRPARQLPHRRNPGGDDAGGEPPPARVHRGHRGSAGSRQKDRNAVRREDGDGNAGRGGRDSVGRRAGWVPHTPAPSRSGPRGPASRAGAFAGGGVPRTPKPCSMPRSASSGCRSGRTVTLLPPGARGRRGAAPGRRAAAPRSAAAPAFAGG